MGGAVKKKLCNHKLCKHCNSNEHKSKDCDHLRDMVLNKGIYTLWRDRDSDEPESSYSRSSIGNCSLIFFDDQSPIGSDDLFYIPRRGDIIKDSDQRLERKPPDKSLRSKFSRQLPAPPRLRRPGRTSSPVSAPVQTCWKENPPDKIIYDENTEAVLSKLYSMGPVEDLSCLVDNFDFFPTICQATTVSNCHTYSNCNIASSMTEIVVHNSLIPSVIVPDMNMMYDNTLYYNAAEN